MKAPRGFVCDAACVVLIDIEELIEEQLNSYEELVTEPHNDHTTIFPLSPTWLLEAQGYNELAPGEHIQQELTIPMVDPDVFLSNPSVTLESPKKSDYVEDPSKLEECFITSFSDLPSNSEVSKKSPEKPTRNPFEPDNKQPKSENTSQKTTC